MYFIASGAVEIAVGEQRLRLGRGDFFGEMALLDQTRRSAAVRSISYSHLLFLPRAAFEEIAQFLPQWRSTLAQVARDRREMTSRNGEAATPEGEPEMQAAPLALACCLVRIVVRRNRAADPLAHL